MKPQTLDSKWRDVSAMVLIAGLVLLFFWRILTPRLADRAAFPPGDFTDQFWMFRVYAARAFAQGRLPLWSENFYSGHPFLADVQSALFYPLSLLWTLIIVTQRGENFMLRDLELEAIFHFILAGAFTYLFAHRMFKHRIAALVTALTFTFSGYLTSYPPQQLAILETATWLPLALYFLERGINRQLLPTDTRLFVFLRASTDLIAAGITLGIAILAGHPQTAMFVVYASLIFFVWRVLELRIANCESRITFSILRLGLVLFAATGISAAQWVPTLEYQMLSTRAAIGWAEAARGFPTLDPIQMILPGFISAFQSPLYIGILPLWLALFALFINRTREKNFWAWLALGSLIVAFGFYAFGFAILYLGVPGFSLFRGQERLALVIAFALAMLAGYGMRELMYTTLDVRRARRAWALLPAGIVISLMFVFTLYISGTMRQSGRVAFLGDRAGLMVLLFTLVTVLVAARLRQRERHVFAGGALALIVFDLFSINNAAYNASIAPRFPVTSLVEMIRHTPGVFRVADEATQPGHFGIAYRLEEIGGISPLRIAYYDQLRDNLPAERIYPLWNVRFLLTERTGFAQAREIAQEGKTRLFELDNPMPRAWFVPYAIQNADEAQVLDALASDAFDPWSVAYLATGSPVAVPPPPLQRDTAPMTHAAEFQRITPEHVRVNVSAPTDGVLVLSEHYYYPGWRAWVDGAAALILRANVAMSAIPVRAGTHQVELRFEPWSVRIGMAISSIMIGLIGLSLLGAMIKRK